MNEYKTKALEIITEWHDMTPEQQLKFCQVCVCKTIKRGRTLKPLYDMEDAVQETYCKMLQRLQDVGKLAKNIEKRANQGFGDSLPAIVTRAANATMEGIAYRHAKDSKATSRTITSQDGDEIDILSTVAATDNTERSATVRATLKDFYSGLDERNKTIFCGMVKRLTEREIAPTVGISHVATHHRIAKIRAELAALL